LPWFSIEEDALSQQQIVDACTRLIAEARTRINKDLKRVLLLPPDLTRAHSGSGKITELLYKELDAGGAFVEVGLLREVGFKFGRWLHVIYMELVL